MGNKPSAQVVRFWALRSTDDTFRLELADGEQTVVTFRDGVCNDVELSHDDCQEILFGSGREERFAGFDSDVDAAWLECNKAFAKRMAEGGEAVAL
jgi:hypothetical protein